MIEPYARQLAELPLTRESVAVLGGTTELWIYGPPDAATTIVMVHGFRGDHHGLEPIVAQLPAYRTIVADLPGFGVSTPLGVDHDIHGYSAWLRELVGKLPTSAGSAEDSARDESAQPRGAKPRLVILGHSFGSIIVAAALAEGLRADDVVLVNPIAAPALSGPRGILTRLAVFYYRVGAWLPERPGFAWLRLGAVTRIMSVTMAKTKDRALRRWIHDQHDQFFGAFSNRSVVLDAFEASVSNDVSEYAARIAPPTLLIASDSDDITPVAAQLTLVKAIPDARLVVLEGVGHLVHYEMPREAADAIEAFLAEPRPGGHPEPSANPAAGHPDPSAHQADPEPRP
ncbi:alpha/beta fold hydrolase [Subtercola boreus]|uniref:Alpha/beta hydrolase n=1 Tax=Subtercola boreus TaxID=120213 RepID=A0A3E0WE76_9MICO|nr:alpha/beta hydrolase [Subtercola boreus]RFA21230.1 alpha/beta hydrolase [Subtercola boreus]RFA21613.1 alpha/beta hydrolase [Subtercola boreus]RFA27582.1 alpha/beta hydrolase [Subtercola boreus]